MGKYIAAFHEKNSHYTYATSVLLDENEICFYLIQVNSVCQGLNKYGKISIHIISH